jgi:hypothetical protein
VGEAQRYFGIIVVAYSLVVAGVLANTVLYEEPLLGTADIQSLADLGNSFAFVDKMNLLPVGSRVPVHLALASLIPMAPLLLTVMPLNDILKRLFDTVL